MLFVSDIIRYFLVQCLYAVDDIRCGELSSEVFSCLYFESDVSIDTGAEVFDSPGRYILFTIACDGRGEKFGGCIYVGDW